jgi:hypothetical protein
VQQEQRRRSRVAGLAVEHLDAIDVHRAIRGHRNSFQVGGAMVPAPGFTNLSSIFLRRDDWPRLDEVCVGLSASVGQGAASAGRPCRRPNSARRLIDVAPPGRRTPLIGPCTVPSDGEMATVRPREGRSARVASGVHPLAAEQCCVDLVDGEAGRDAKLVAEHRAGALVDVELASSPAARRDGARTRSWTWSGATPRRSRVTK